MREREREALSIFGKSQKDVFWETVIHTYTEDF